MMGINMPKMYSDYRKYGVFEKGQFRITRPDTPRPWMNYIGNSEYCVRFSQTGGGDSFHKFPRVNNITFAHYDDTPEFYDDRPGRWVYLRDEQDGRIWSLNWQPVMQKPQAYSCIHAPGYSIINSRNNDIESSLRLFVPLDDCIEIWTVILKNCRSTDARITAFPFVEWFVTDDICKCGFFGTNHAQFDPQHNFIYYWNQKKQLPQQYYSAFMASDFIPDGYELSRREFLGLYGTYQMPVTVVKGRCNGKTVDYEPMVGVLQKSFVLKPDQELAFTVVIGSVQDKNEAVRLKTRYLDPNIIKQSFSDLTVYWKNRLATAQVQTPSLEFNQLINTWLKYQVHTTSFWVRPGGDKGFRDICQDAENILPFDSNRTKDLLLEAMRHQYKSGKAVRQWSQTPGGPLDTRDYRDSPVWLAYSVCEYVKETGDSDFLNIKVPYLDGLETSVYEHICQAVDCLWNDRGEHGLSRIGCGDWNDGLDEVGLKDKGESVWLSIALVRGLNEVSSLADFIGDSVVAQNYSIRAQELKNIINRITWDGNWYIRAINDDGIVLGTNKAQEGKIFLLPQAWAMLAGVSDHNQNERMIKAIEDMMMTDYGPIKISPTYTKYQEGIGKIAYRPGFSEAGAVYIHAAAFLIAGLCEIGEGDKAFDIFNRIIPTNPSNPSDTSWSEPYALANFYMGPQTVCPGRTLYGWLTASGGWMFKNGLARICGIQPTYTGLDIKPCLPKAWSQINLKRYFRNAWFNIEINQTGKKSVIVNGEPSSLPIKNIQKGATYSIEVTI